MQGASANSAEWRRSWPLPFVSAVGYAASVTHLYTIGLFIEPIEREFLWSRSDITLGLTICSAVIIVSGAFCGMLVDRWGPRRIAIAGLCFYCAVLAMFSFAGPSIWSWWVLWLFLGIGAVSIQPFVWTAAVASEFQRNRGLALAITMSGGSICSAVAPLLANHYISAFGWRGAYLGLAGTVAVAALPLVILFFAKASLPARAMEESHTDSAQVEGMELREALLSRRFLSLAFVSLAMTASMMALLVHIVPILTSAGLDRPVAAAAAGVIGICSLAGRLAGGFLLDRLPGTLVGGCVFALPVVATALLLLAEPTAVTAIVTAALLGFAVGGEVDILAYMTSRYFGLKRFGTLFAIVSIAGTIGVGVGPLLASLIYDSYGTYHPFLLVVMAASLAAVGIGTTLGPYPAE